MQIISHSFIIGLFRLITNLKVIDAESPIVIFRGQSQSIYHKMICGGFEPKKSIYLFIYLFSFLYFYTAGLACSVMQKLLSKGALQFNKSFYIDLTCHDNTYL